MPRSSGMLRRRVAGALLMALGAFALAAPLAAGRWSLAILGIPLIVLSVAEAYAAFTSPQRAEASAYLPSLLALLAGNLLLLSSALVLSGLLILLIAILVIDGFGKILTVWRQAACGTRSHGRQRARRFRMRGAALVSQSDHRHGAGDWHRRRRLYRGGGVADADGAGRSRDARRDRRGAERPPGPGLGLPPNETFARLRAEADSATQTVRATDLMWMLTLGGVFLAIHLGRMPISDSLLGISSPFVATAGDLLMTLVWRRFSCFRHACCGGDPRGRSSDWRGRFTSARRPGPHR